MRLFGSGSHQLSVKGQSAAALAAFGVGLRFPEVDYYIFNTTPFSSLGVSMLISMLVAMLTPKSIIYT